MVKENAGHARLRFGYEARTLLRPTHHRTSLAVADRHGAAHLAQRPADRVNQLIKV
jgi:hypothetical protein